MWRFGSHSLHLCRPSPSAIATMTRAMFSAGVDTQPQQQAPPAAIGKEILLQMRKQTGYSYVKCRKALVECGGEQHYEEALRWLKETAAKEGWAKAAKLSTRNASQGLCGLAPVGSNAVVFVELNCETDFVSRSEPFKQLVASLTTALADYAAQTPSLQNQRAETLDMQTIDASQFSLADGRTAEAAIVATVGQTGENIRLGRAAVVRVPSPAHRVFGKTHPKENFDGVQMGRFVSFVALTGKTEMTESKPPEEWGQLGEHICQHIIRMVPESLGKAGAKKPKAVTEEKARVDGEEQQATNDTEAKMEGAKEKKSDISEEVTIIEGDETELLHQSFMLNPKHTVAEHLDFHGVAVVDFMRVELGREEITKGVA